MENLKYQEKTYSKDSLIWIENSKAMPYLFIVKSGRLKQVYKIGDHREEILLKERDTFGLIACLTGHNYINRMTALTDCTVILIKRDDVIPFLSSNPDTFLKIIGDYSSRLRKVNQKLFALCSQSIYTELPEHLLEMAEYFKKQKKLNHCLYALKKYVQYANQGDLKARALKEIDVLRKDYNAQIEEANVIESHIIYKPGDIIFLEQEKGERFYFIERGKVKISHIDRNNEFVIAVLKQGEIFGEMAILNQTARNASAIAFDEVRLLVLTKENFMSRLDITLLQKIFTSMAKRIWYSYRRALNLSYEDPVTRLYDCLDFIIQTKEGKKKAASYFFDITLTDLRVMTNTMEVDENYIVEFLSDNNIRLNYGHLTIMNVDKFYVVLNRLLSREKQY